MVFGRGRAGKTHPPVCTMVKGFSVMVYSVHNEGSRVWYYSCTQKVGYFLPTRTLLKQVQESGGGSMSITNTV